MNPQTVCRALNPFIQGWANYHRVNCAKRTFKALDDWNYKRALYHLRHKHAKDGPCTLKWFREQGYLGHLNPLRGDNYLFGNKKKRAYLKKFAWFSIQRHTLVKGTNS